MTDMPLRFGLVTLITLGVWDYFFGAIAAHELSVPRARPVNILGAIVFCGVAVTAVLKTLVR